jgi:peroxiredoxin
LRSFQERLEEFESRGVRLAAVSVDLPEVSREHCAKQGYTYTFLSDPEARAIQDYDLLHPGAAPGGKAIARPAEFLIDTTGTVRWVNLTADWRVRPRPEDVLRVIDDLRLSESPP